MDAPIQVRPLALDSLESSFYFRQTAGRLAQAIVDDPAEPEALRAKARSVSTF